MNKRDISRTYKERRRLGGVYRITNTVNGRYLLGYAADVASARNRFAFAQSTGSAVDPRLRADWQEQGPQAFTLEVLEELEQGPEQSESEFLEDLRTLEGLWREKLDARNEY